MFKSKKQNWVSALWVVGVLTTSFFTYLYQYPKSAQAIAPTYAYVTLNSGSCQLGLGTTQCIDQVQIKQSTGSAVVDNVLTNYTYVDGSKYDFRGSTPEGKTATIHVDIKNPGSASLTPAGQKAQTISISQPEIFTSVFSNGAPESASTSVIDVSLVVDFGTTDTTLTVPEANITVTADLLPDGLLRAVQPDETTLTSSKATYNEKFLTEGPGLYRVCAEASFIKATDHKVCLPATKVKGKVLPVKLTADGDVSKLASSNLDNITVDCGPTFSLNWFLCPVFKGMGKIVDALDRLINGLLYVNTSSIFGTDDTSKAYYQAWSSMRTIALGIIAITGLTMVIAQALGMEIFDAYTVKKVLPRLIIASIGISLSYPLMEFFIGLTNQLGLGVRTLIYTPFQSLGTGIHLGSGTTLGLTLLTAGAIAAFTVLGMVSFAGTAILALAIAFFVLVIRQLVITVLILLAPIAIACYVLPNTQKVYKVWFDSFAKALLMFPLISALVAVGRVFALTSMAANGGNPNAVQQLIGFASYFAPYFLIPLTFKFAGSALGRIGGFANDRSRGGFDRLRNFRGNRSKKRMAELSDRAKSGKIFKTAPADSRRGAINRGIQGATVLGQAGANPMRMRARMGEALSRASEQQRDKMLEDHDYTSKSDDDWNRAASEASNENDFRQIMSTRYAGRYTGPNGVQNRERDVARYRTMNNKYGRDALRQASFLQAVAGGTAFEGGDVWQAAAAAAGGDRGVLASLVGKGRSLAMNAGRVDQGGAGFGDTLKIAQKFMDAEPGYTVAQANQDLVSAVYEGQGAATLAHASMKPRAVQNLVPEIQRRLQVASQSGDQAAYDRELATFANLYDSMAATSPNKAKILADGVLNWSAPLPNGAAGPAQSTIQMDMESRRGSAAFTSLRREINAGQQESNRVSGAQGGGPATGGTPGALPGGPPGL
ncbi:MAG: hypothetical protein QFB87_00710 [Patescibacteria group bacterium]|nr:hypothetical protein [Patescibacteria group bacterium]